MTISEKIKIIDNKIGQNKAQYDLDRQQVRFYHQVISSGNVGKYKFLTGKYVLLETGQLEKAATIKRFEYSPLGIELKKQTDIAKERYQGLDEVY